ncbi:DUF4440 domain-containing protein [Mycobacterium sp. 852013-50091_SCH5140682]|uniref:nuclear transport factor 2 family protein n=1 Tax=Mycobacterium sp. 852013-50091_SCH5140682 TaxID=1834109 RepID=UPI0007EBAF5F|nr:nuclear transport factor 2 family protein [Mycobacterium sp. 852013-50091_SCH5140682]OBC01814.1 DUF4440 domain-containing protein [Mycobacterium sp. 852013-50091_SCH5140682]
MTLHEHHTPTEWESLPTTIKRYLIAHDARDTGEVLSTFTTDAVVTDEHRNYVGHDEIRAWLTGSASEYTYTTKFVGATTIGADRVEVVQHLEGNFPGGVTDLYYRFGLDGDLISRLVIEP